MVDTEVGEEGKGGRSTLLYLLESKFPPVSMTQDFEVGERK